MTGTLTFTTESGKTSESSKVKIEDKDDVDAIRGRRAGQVDMVFIELKTPADFDLAIQAMTLAKETLAGK